jgi:hypothetical protein
MANINVLPLFTGSFIKRVFDYLYPTGAFLPFKHHSLTGPYECDAPVFIIGSGRSGNTLLRRLLMASGQIYFPPETYVLGDMHRFFRRNAYFTWSELCECICAKFEYYPEFKTMGVSSLAPYVHQAKSLPKTQHTFAGLVDALYRWLAEANGFDVKRWGDKTPLNVFCARELAGVFPDAQFIYIIRDGIDVIHSYVEAGIYSSYLLAAQRWIDSNRICMSLSHHYPNRVRKIRYEDLVRQPAEVMKETCNWANINYSDEMLIKIIPPKILGDVAYHSHHSSVEKPITSSSIGKGKRSLSKETIDGLPRVFFHQMAQLGYVTTLEK